MTHVEDMNTHNFVEAVAEAAQKTWGQSLGLPGCAWGGTSTAS